MAVAQACDESASRPFAVARAAASTGRHFLSPSKQGSRLCHLSGPDIL
jgi:hypothetical protein